MKIEEECALSFYKSLTPLDTQGNVTLVWREDTKKLFVKKVISVYNKSVYDFLKLNPIYGTPKIREVFQDGERLVVIEDYISGITLREKLQHEGKICQDEAVRVSIELLDILGKLHQSKMPIVHRDVKPKNIMISDEVLCI